MHVANISHSDSPLLLCPTAFASYCFCVLLLLCPTAFASYCFCVLLLLRPTAFASYCFCVLLLLRPTAFVHSSISIPLTNHLWRIIFLTNGVFAFISVQQQADIDLCTHMWEGNTDHSFLYPAAANINISSPGDNWLFVFSGDSFSQSHCT